MVDGPVQFESRQVFLLSSTDNRVPVTRLRNDSTPTSGPEPFVVFL